jgi:threonine dehydrogenase-like Zn-dependent dehydrogenase
MSEQMRQVLVRSIDEVTVEKVPVPGTGEVLLRTTVAGVCGSDMHAALGSHPFIDLPYRPGHELVATVVETGHGFQARDRVVVEPNLFCGDCAQCRAGRYNICRELKVFGCQTPGGMADLFAIAADRLHPVPEAMSDQAAALVEPLATPVHAVSKAGDLRGRTVVVLGAGPIGPLVLVAARRAGAERVVITDLLASKRERALRMGADAAVPADDPDLVALAHAALARRSGGRRLRHQGAVPCPGGRPGDQGRAGRGGRGRRGRPHAEGERNRSKPALIKLHRSCRFS